MKTQTTITDLTHEDLVNLFSAAFYGSNYLSADYEESVEYDEDDCYEDIMANILLNGGKIMVTDSYADGCHYGTLKWQYNEDYDVTYDVRIEDIKRGLERAANGTFNAGVNENSFGTLTLSEDYQERNIEFAKRSFNAFAFDEREWDAITADCLMQIILFNEIVYG